MESLEHIFFKMIKDITCMYSCTCYARHIVDNLTAIRYNYTGIIIVGILPRGRMFLQCFDFLN
jgi:hypothetical protein